MGYSLKAFQFLVEACLNTRLELGQLLDFQALRLIALGAQSVVFRWRLSAGHGAIVSIGTVHAPYAAAVAVHGGVAI